MDCVRSFLLSQYLQQQTCLAAELKGTKMGEGGPGGWGRGGGARCVACSQRASLRAQVPSHRTVLTLQAVALLVR